MNRAKGTILVDFVKTIKADKTGVFDQYLTAQDKDLLNQHILPSAWYPYETFKNCFNAAFKVIAKSNLESVRVWGQLYGQQIMSDLYKGLLKQGEPLDYLKKYQVYIKNFFDFGKVEVIEEKPNQVLVRFKDFDSEFAPIYYMFMGWLEKTIELCGAKNIRAEIAAKSWQDQVDAAIRLSWT